MLAAFTSTGIYPWRYASAAAPAPKPASTSAPVDVPAARAADALRRAKAALQALNRDMDAGKDIRAHLDTLKAQRQAVATADPQIRAEFSQTESTLLNAKLADAVTKRHAQAVAEYDREITAALAELDDVERMAGEHRQAVASGDEAGARIKYDNLKNGARKAKALLDTKVKDKAHARHDPNRMPYRPAESKNRKPRLKKDEYREYQTHPRVASAGPLTEILLVQAGDLPTPADLAETSDVQFTPGIRQLADELGRDPAKMYYFVRNKIRFVPTYGSIQGAEACRVSLECNAFDTASLLIALLRVSGVPARYVPGTVELAPDFFRSAMGDFQDLGAAGRLAASGGIPTVVVNDPSGRPVGVRMEHIWVEAYLDYVPGRGVRRETGDTWVALDAALKRMRFRAPLDVTTPAGVDIPLLLEELRPTATVGSDGSVTGVSSALARDRVIQFQQATVDYINQNHATATVGDILGALEIQSQVSSSVLPNSLPGRVLTTGERVSALPAQSHHKVTIRLFDGSGTFEQLSLQSTTVELAGKRISLGYTAATPEDIATIKAFGGFFQAPPYLVQVKPSILLDGSPVTTAGAISMGTEQTLQLAFEEPDGSRDVVEHKVVAGTYAVVGLDLQRVSDTALNQSKARLETVQAQLNDTAATFRFDELMGGILQVHAQSYFLQVEAYNRVLGHRMSVVNIKRPAEMLATFAPVYATLFGSPVRVVNSGMNVDVRRYVVSASSRDGSRAKEISYLLGTGTHSSFAENSVFEQLHRTRSVSAVQLITEANNRGIPVYRIDASNQSQLIPLLRVAPQVVADVQNAVAAGKHVLIPRDEIAFFSWRGSGYIVTDPATGAGAYLISGGLAGGGTAESSEFADMLRHLFEFGGYAADIAVILLAGLALHAAILHGLGILLAALFVIATFWYVYNKTGDPWAALTAGAWAALAALVVGVVGWAVAATVLLGSALLDSLIFFILIAIIAFLVVDLIVRLLTAAADILRRRFYAASDLPEIKGCIA